MLEKEYTPLLHYLRTHGYRESNTITLSGDLVVRGDTLEVWPAGQNQVYRLHYFGEQLERVERKHDDKWEPANLPNLVPNALQTKEGEIFPGEYIVHPFHGVGIFQGVIEERDYTNQAKVYLSLEYAGNDRLLVPFNRQEELMPYIGSRHPRLTRLHSKVWENTKARIQRDLIKVARALLKIYAARQLNPRTPYTYHPDWEAQLDKSAGFELTSDQAKALADIKLDLCQNNQPMDRLICGDVAFGKTEVAIRAAAQVMAAGKQVAFLAPTTILVEQHAAVVAQRFQGLPVKTGHLSRLTKSTDPATLKAIQNGSLDLVVGTHRLLGQDIAWKNLGLLIIDEEQKFGVAHKERLKQLRPHLDVLALSATPIPRTLSMSLSGLRGLSILRHAPHGRLPIATQVAPYNDDLITQALRQELSRGGQVYVVHNRILPLEYLKTKLAGLAKAAGFPKARLAVAHGQLSEIELGRRMAAFMNQEIDILVASTIVEHGLDSPTANTLIVLRSEQLGLSDLYQIRGRVGRRQIQAYAYFLTGSVHQADDPDLPADQAQYLSDSAQQRLAALLEADQLGSGWSIALRDLEIRGGGNILGHEQHGSMESIGLLLYAQLLQEEIGKQAQAAGIQLFQKKES